MLANFQRQRQAFIIAKMVKQISCQRRAFTFLIFNHICPACSGPQYFDFVIFFSFATYLHICFSCMRQDCITLISVKKKIESAAGEYPCDFFLNCFKLADGLSRSDFDSIVLHICGTSVHWDVALIFVHACWVVLL